MKLDTPNPDQFVDENRALGKAWVPFFTKLVTYVVANSQSGTTAQRPTKGLSPGDKFYDSSLGYMIHVRSVGPVVWIRWDGTVV